MSDVTQLGFQGVYTGMQRLDIAFGWGPNQITKILDHWMHSCLAIRQGWKDDALSPVFSLLVFTGDSFLVAGPTLRPGAIALGEICGERQSALLILTPSTPAGIDLCMIK